MFTWLEGSCTSPLVGSTPGGKCDWIYVFMHVGLVYCTVGNILTFLYLCLKLIHLSVFVNTVKDFSIFVPSYISDSDICFKSVLVKKLC